VTETARDPLTGLGLPRKLTAGPDPVAAAIFGLLPDMQITDPSHLMTANSTLRPRPGVVARDMNGSAVLVHLDTNRIYELNATGARIWSMLEQGLDRAEIGRRLGEEFGVAGDELEQSVDDILTELTREGLIGV
jgi:coenzyme PQQ synthesis protein D (PqqD)